MALVSFGLRVVLLPHRDGLGNGVDVILLVFGAVIHSACEGVHAAVVVRVLRLWGDLRLYCSGGWTLSHISHLSQKH